MAKCFVFLTLLLAAGVSNAGEKTCKIKGMHCGGCVEMVKDRLCNDKFSTCEVTIQEEKKEKFGLVHLKTKKSDDVINEKELGEALADTEYSLTKCETGSKKTM